MKISIKRRLVIFLLTMVGIFLIPTVIYAAYVSVKNINGTAHTGTIVLNSNQKYYSIYTYDDVNTFSIDESSSTFCPTNVNNDTYAISNGRIRCYATKKTNNSYIENYIQLNQLGFKFTFTNTIDVYLRIRLEDSWISTKIYRNGTVRSQVITKDSNSIKNALSTLDSSGNVNWIYDDYSGYIYYHAKIDGNSSPKTLEIKFLEDYYYVLEQVSSYTENVVVVLGYEIDIVQANRAEKKWNVDLNSIFSEGATI